jgi:hypothetical protein
MPSRSETSAIVMSWSVPWIGPSWRRCQKPEGCPADAGGRGAGSFLDTGLQLEHNWAFREPPGHGNLVGPVFLDASWVQRETAGLIFAASL